SGRSSIALAMGSGASRMSLTPIRQYLEVLYPEIAVDAEELHITRYTSWGAAVLAAVLFFVLE
ncbi:hypothetical protein, partial [Providencia stuartii]|uniref:hypothetical protein n=1 Tax=Providencia stuartii TaxID=588 RepID=UPI001953C20D